MSKDAIVIPGRAVRRLLVAILVVGAIGAISVALWSQRDRLSFGEGIGDQLDARAYQAVYLVGGQLYFGKLATRGDEWLALSNVYYFPPTEGVPSPNPQAGQLVKRGRELTGPREPMLIPVRAVLFIENLREDSEVMQAIRRFESGAPAPSPVAPAGSPRPSPTR